SREALLGLTVILVYYWWRTRYRVQMALVAVCGCVTLVMTQSSLWERLSVAVSSGGAGRIAIWRVGLEAFRHNWLIGYGMGNFTSTYDTFYVRVLQAYSENGWSSAPHNVLLQIGVELGLVGLALLGWFLVTTFMDLRLIRPESPLYEDRIMMEAALLALFAVSMFLGLFNDKFVWLVFAMAAQLRLLGLREARDARERPPAQRQDSGDQVIAPGPLAELPT
ncbi:MAG: O-antigen ligase family protein, partial [bacterium]|nr:O-antigen ligase family protein [bacterium]